MRTSCLAIGACVLAAAIGEAASREVAAGVEHLHFRTAPTPLNRDDVLGLGSATDLLRIGGSWKETRGAVRGVARGVFERRFGNDDDTSLQLREAYLQLSGLAGGLRAGKQHLGWGSGFAWNPTNRLEAPKNPLNTSLEQEGVWAARGDWTPSASVSLTLVGARIRTRLGDLPVPLPVTTRSSGGAARLRLLVEDTDVAFVLSLQEDRDPLFGLDLGRGLGRSVAAHLEAAVYHGSELSPARAQAFLRVAAGLLYTRGEQAFAFEYFHNGEGYDDAARGAWLASLDASYRRATNPVLPPAVRDQARFGYLAQTTAPYEGLGLGRDYVHASWTRSRVAEDWGLFVRAVASMTDGGVALTPGISYAPGDRFTLQLDGLILLGPADSEYRLSPVRGGVVTRARVAF